MKFKLLPLAVMAALPFSAFAEGPIDGTLYGKVNLTVDRVKQELEIGAASDDASQWELNTNASRIGVKGKSDLTDSLKVIYKLEWEVDTAGDGTDLKARNRYVGLSGGFGTVIGGKHDTPTKLAQNKIDLFNDLYGDIKNTFEGENRINNIVMYTTPTWGPLSVTAAFAPAEDAAGSGVPSGDNKAGETGDDGIADGISIAAQLDFDNVYIALAADKDIDGQDLVRLVGQFDLGPVVLGAMLQQNEDAATGGDNRDESGIFVSAAMKVGSKGKIKFQYGQTEDDALFDVELDTLSLGYDHKLGKSTKAFVYATQNSGKADTIPSIEGTETALGFGLEHKF
ncbi:porin [Aurantivibrio plasticivorans]